MSFIHLHTPHKSFSLFCACPIWCSVLFGGVIFRPSDSSTCETLLSLTLCLPFFKHPLWFTRLILYVFMCCVRCTRTTEILICLRLSALFRGKRCLSHLWPSVSVCSFSPFIYFLFLSLRPLLIVNLKRFINRATSLTSHCCSQHQKAIKYHLTDININNVGYMSVPLTPDIF